MNQGLQGPAKRGWQFALAAALLSTAPLMQAQTAPQTAVGTSVAVPALRPIDAETHTPVRVLRERDLAALAGLGLGEALQRLPFMGASAPNLNSNAVGDGSVVADIGGFGPARCVVMLNGHRLPVNELMGSPAVDLDVIPVSSIDRVEIFLGGASPAWGADAVAGVINVITKSEADGMVLAAAGSRTSSGDGAQARASLFEGKVFGRGHVSLAAEYRHEDPIASNARSFSSRSEALACHDGPGCVWPFGSSATPAGNFLVPDGNTLGLPAGRYTADGQGGWRAFRAFGPTNDLYSTQTDSYLRAGRSGGSIVTHAGFDFSEATSMTFELLAAKDRTRRQLPSLPLTTSATATAAPVLSIGGIATLVPAPVAANSFYNPFGVALTDVQRRLVELGPRSFRDDSDMEFASTTLRHAAGQWDLEGSLSWGRSSITEQINDVFRGDRLALASGPSGRDATGAIRCGVPDDQTGIVGVPIAGCVPLDLFHGPGSISRAMLDYIVTPVEDVVRTTQTEVSLVARREFASHGEAPARRLAVGFESRRLSEHSDFADLGPFAVIDPLPGSGTVTRNDLFAEVSWPWKGSAGGGAISTLTAGGRLSRSGDSSTVGGAFAGITWRPSLRTLVRSRFTQVYRAPTAGELFLGRQSRALPLHNPCLDAASLSSALCVAATGSGLASNPVIVNAPVTESDYFIAGNPRLRPERGYSASTGFVWNALEHPERLVGIDFTWVRLIHVIRPPGVLELIAACRSGNSPAACARVVPVQGGNAFAVDGAFINGGRDEMQRLDLEIRDSWRTRLGEWHFDMLAGYLLARRMKDINGAGIDLRGTFDVVQSSSNGTAYPILQSQARLQWKRESWALDWMLQYVGPYHEVRDNNGLLSAYGGTVRRVGAVAYHDMTLSWAFRRSSFLRFSVQNVFDRAPPRVNNGLEDNTDAPTYRLEGRVFSLGVEISP